ncbi:45749_t:CDS:2, partial [Gigaspora margarita]
VQQEIIRKYTGRRQNSKFIFMGDFNIMVDDKETIEKQKGKNKSKHSQLEAGTGPKKSKNRKYGLFFGSDYNAPLAEEALEKSILKTAMKHILKKKICKTRATRDGKKRPRLNKLIVKLDRWKEYQKKFQIEIKNINRKWENKDIEDLTKKNNSKLTRKTFNYAIVDKLLENQNNTRVLIYNPEKVKEKTKEFFQKQFRKRGFDSNALKEKWAKVYTLLERVQKK